MTSARLAASALLPFIALRSAGNAVGRLVEHDPRDRVASAEIVAGEPAADHRSGAADSTPAVHVRPSSCPLHDFQSADDLNHHVQRRSTTINYRYSLGKNVDAATLPDFTNFIRILLSVLIIHVNRVIMKYEVMIPDLTNVIEVIMQYLQCSTNQSVNGNRVSLFEEKVDCL